MDDQCPWTKIFDTKIDNFSGVVDSLDKFHRIKSIYEESTTSTFSALKTVKAFGKHGRWQLALS